jgi:ribosomal protein S18 acetylase RimI-like enzyme
MEEMSDRSRFPIRTNEAKRVRQHATRRRRAAITNLVQEIPVHFPIDRTMEIVFKKAESEDISKLVEFMEEYYEYDHLVFDRRIAHKALGELLGEESLGSVWLIQCDGKEVGYIVVSFICSLEFHGRAAFIDEMYIREGYRKRGIGVKALEFVVEFCRSKRIDALRLEVEHSNVQAQSIYKKFGFAAHDRFIMTRWINPKSD